ncbi:MAG: hypothetical protein KDE27_12980 [Planctomycetes bacterium]|nr:hypothetical protein [Planctomycetota bacterium]
MNMRTESPCLPRRRGAIVAIALLALAGCSGGGGGSAVGPGPGPGPIQRAPATAVYLAANGRQLFEVPDDASALPVALGSPAMTTVRGYAVSPDGGAVAFVADRDTVDRYELYVAEIGGSGPIRVSVLANTFDDVMDFAWAPDSRSLAYRADGIVDDRAELFRVGRDGGSHYRVYQSGIASIFVAADYGWSPDSRHLFCMMQQTTTRFELRLHDASTGSEGASTVLSVPPGRDIRDVTFSPDSAWIALRSDHARAEDQFQVFRRRTDLGTALELSNGTTGSSVRIGDYAWSYDSRWLAQTVLTHPAGAMLGVNVYELANDYSRRALSSSTVERWEWAPQSNRLAIAADYDPVTNTPAGAVQLVVHDADANTRTVANAAVPPGQTILGELFAWAPDGQHLAYATRVSFLDHRVWIVATDGSGFASEAIDAVGQQVVRLSWNRDGSRLATLVRNETQAFHPGEWFLLGIDGHTVFRSGTFNTYFTSQTLRWSKDGIRAVYAIDAAASGPDRLRAVGLDGTGDVGLTNDASLSFDYASASITAP